MHGLNKSDIIIYMQRKNIFSNMTKINSIRRAEGTVFASGHMCSYLFKSVWSIMNVVKTCAAFKHLTNRPGLQAVF